MLMRALPLLSLCFFIATARGAHIESILQDHNIQATAQTLIPQIQWIDNPTEAYYRCTDSNSDGLVAELWQGPVTQVKLRQGSTQALLYGEQDSLKVFHYQGEDGKPWLATFLVLDSGETHFFRVSATQEIIKSSMELHCKAAPYISPPAAALAS